MENIGPFVIVTTVAVVLQMLILLVMAIVMLKLRSRIEVLADKVEETTTVVKDKVLPILDNAQVMQQQVKGFLDTTRPKIDTLVDNLSKITTTARTTAERFDVTANDAIDRIRLQVIRGDEMITRTMDRVEETSEKVQHSVMSPVRQVTGIMQAISIGVGAYFNQQKRRRNGGPSDEMFI